MRVLITGACGVTSRAIARSLRASTRFAGTQLIGTDICENPYGLYEGLFDRIVRAPRVSEAHYGDWMRAFCESTRVDAAIVIPELEVLYWSKRQFPVPVLLPPPGFCSIAVSKRRVHDRLAPKGLVPTFAIHSREELMRDAAGLSFPCWIRDFAEGGSSGKGALLAHDHAEARAWAVLNRGIDSFMASDYLPGRNFACHLLYDAGRVVKIGCYERLEYFMARTVMSGVSGNISRGRLLNDARLPRVAQAAVDAILEETGESMQGMVAVDLREASDGRPLVTEINLRHVAATSAFAAAGFNLAEFQLMVTLGRTDGMGPVEAVYPHGNAILRDIDGTPVWLADYRPLAEGEAVPPLDDRTVR